MQRLRHVHSCKAAHIPLYAQVEYLSDGFLEKNRDTVYEEQINILKASKVRIEKPGLQSATSAGPSSGY